MSPQKSAAVSVIGLVLMGFLILSTDEAPSTVLAMVQYVAIGFCLVGLVGSLVKMAKGG